MRLLAEPDRMPVPPAAPPFATSPVAATTSAPEPSSQSQSPPLPIGAAQFIPDFCRGEAIVLLMVVMELMAVLLVLAGETPGGLVFNQIVLLSLHLQWIALSSAAVLCLARSRLAGRSTAVVFFVSWGLLLLMTVLTADAVWWISHTIDGMPKVIGSRGSFLLRNALISAIVSFLLLHYFWSRAQLLAQARADSEARYLALQARIRPHFLFNSLNSIAALILSRPEQAEEMVVDLADLFRVSLEKSNRLVRLDEEVDFAKTYLRIEQVRLGDKLSVVWDIAPDAAAARVPLLMLQPLVENAVYHGISRLTTPGTVTVSARRELGRLVLDVENPLPPQDAPEKKGTGVALENIAQRLKLIYGEQAKLIQGAESSETGAIYRTRIRVPFKTIEAGVPVAAMRNDTGAAAASGEDA